MTDSSLPKAYYPVYYGKSGTGKSYLAGSDIEDVVIEHDTFTVILDKGKDHLKLARQLGFDMVDVDPQFINSVSGVEFWTEYIRGAYWKDDVNGIWIGLDDDSEFNLSDTVKLGNDVAGGMYMVGDRDMPRYLYIGELKNFAPDQMDKSDIYYIIQCITEGRKEGVRCGSDSQKPHQVSSHVREEFNIFKILYLGSRTDRPYRKLSIGSEMKSEIMSWGLKDRNVWVIDELNDVDEVRNTSGLDRRTPHNG